MISVCMATHNGEKYIRQQLESILSQLEPDDEVIISDDSSSDQTLAIVRSFQDARIVVLENQTFFNHVYNFENALKSASGDIILFSDQDDIWLTGKIDLVRKKFANNTHRYYVLCSDGFIVNEGGTILEDSILKKIRAGNGIPRNIFNSTYMGCCMAFSSEMRRIALPFPRNLPMHDAWIGLLGEVFGRTEFVPEKLIHYRRHAATVTEFRIRFRPIIQIRRRLVLIINLLLRSLAFRKEIGAEKTCTP